MYSTRLVQDCWIFLEFELMAFVTTGPIGLLSRPGDCREEWSKLIFDKADLTISMKLVLEKVDMFVLR